jgi:cytochrome c551/c552
MGVRGSQALLMSLAAFCLNASAFEPQVNYMLQCMGCHAPDGRGEPGHVPSVKASLLPFAKLTAGRSFLVQVPGAAQSTLSDAELAQLLNWMISNLSATKSDRFSRFTEAEVARYRRTPLVQVTAARKALLKMTTGSQP